MTVLMRKTKTIPRRSRLATAIATLSLLLVVLPTVAAPTAAADTNPALAAELSAQRAIWDAADSENYSFTYERICFCPPFRARVQVTNGVAAHVPTPVLAELFPGDSVPTIDELFDEAASAVGREFDSETITFDGDYGFPAQFDSVIDDPNVQDGFFGFRILEFTDLDAVRSDLAEGQTIWDAEAPSSYRFTYQRSCFCPPPFGDVAVTVINGVVTEVTGEGLDPNFAFTPPTIAELVATAPPSLSSASLFDVEIDPAWGFASSRSSNASPLGIADGFFSETITDFVPLNAGFCGGMAPTIIGTSGDDVLTGTDGPDVIMGFGGNDQIYGLGGDDFLCGGSGDDIIGGGAGNDHIAGDDGDDELFGQADADTLEGGFGVDKLRGGAGEDRLVGGPGDDDLNGSRDNDAVHGESGGDTVRGGTGDDLITGGRGVDLVSGNGGSDMIHGGDGDDELRGGPRPDTLHGDDGNDLLRGFKGADTLHGGDGDDDLRGNEQPDTLNGNAGIDTCNGGPELEQPIPIGAINCTTVLNVP